LWGCLLCVGTRTKPPTGQHSFPPTTLLSRSFPPSLLNSTTHHTTTTRNPQSPLQTSSLQRSFLHNLLETHIKVDTQTRALAQDDNSEPRRSPIQVLTAQRFPPNSCSALRVSLRLTTTSCVARLMCFFPTVCFFCSAAITAHMDAQRMPQDTFQRTYRPGTGSPHGHFSSVSQHRMLPWSAFDSRDVAHCPCSVCRHDNHEASLPRLQSYDAELSKRRSTVTCGSMR
jgi:hypothetical protein